MSQINVNPTPPPRGTPPPPPPRRWPIYVFIALVVVVLAAIAIARQVSNNNTSSTTTATATPATVIVATSTVPAGAPTSTPGASSVATATPLPAGVDTATPTTGSSGGQTQLPTNPNAMHVANGSCTSHSMTWRWSGASGTTSYEVVLYNPRTGAIIKDTTTTASSYTLPAAPGARVALKVRSHNGAGAARDYFTPGSVGHVPFIATNPTNMTETTTGHTLTWFWTGARHATAYDFALYHYTGGVAHDDISGRTDQGHWATKVTPGIKYYLKVRSVGACPPSTFYTPPVPGQAGA